jgi:hypothetical protein
MRATILILLAAPAWCDVESKRTVEKTMPLAAGGTLHVCGLNGSVRIEPGSNAEVRFTVHEKLKGETQGDLDELKREVDVVITGDAQHVRAGVKSPWSDGVCGAETKRKNYWRGRDKHFSHEFIVQAPRDVRLEVSSVNGSLDIKDMRGDYKLKTVNGSIKLNDAEGSGEIGTVNGGVTAVFRNNPRSDTSLKTVNGKLALYLQPTLNADFSMKTVNGSAYTDFDMTPIGTSSASETKSGNKIVYKRGNSVNMRAGSGGPKITAETVNGSVMLHSLAKGRP